MADNDPYNFSDRYTLDSLDKESDKFEHRGEFTVAQTNETERSLSGQLILVTTVLLTVSMIVLGDDGRVFRGLTHGQKVYIFAAILFEVIAIIAGIINYLRIEDLYKNWAEIYYKCAWFINGMTYKTPGELKARLFKEVKRAKNRKVRIALWVQIGAIITSLGIYLLLVYSILVYVPHKASVPANRQNQVKIMGPDTPFIIKSPN